MTEDQDDRMERAERIRKLREQGGGSDPDTQSSDDGTEATEAEGADTAAGAGENTASGGGGGAATAQVTSGATGVELPDQEQIEAAIGEEGAVEATPADESEGGVGAAGRSEGSAAVSEAQTRVLEFTLGDELYCIDIESVEEIVKRETITRVPNTPEYVEGVVDLRGQITTILDAKRMLAVDAHGPESLIVVFAPDAFEEQGAVGWIVDAVRQVRPVTDDQVRQPPTDDHHVEGIVDREDADELIVWVRPGMAMGDAVGEDDEDEDR